jgi:triosephosphate isomerase (TIM)
LSTLHKGFGKMALKKLIAGNWKMNGALSSMPEVEAIVAAALASPHVDVALCPPATLISALSAQKGLAVGGQDCHWNASGAHTGCLSVSMLREAGASIVIVGHSERRTDNGETDADVQRKAAAVIAGGLTAIICVGETEAQRDAGQAVDVVTSQIEGSMPQSAIGATTVVAYEPMWAIGTGRVPETQDVAEMHAAIRDKLVSLFGEEGQKMRILYGGSVKASNARELLAVPDVDGALVGGASLKAADFIPIIEAAH